MLRPISIALLAGVMLISFAALPAMLPSSTTLALSGSALAAKNLNSSRSNVNRMGGGGGKKAARRAGKKNNPAASRGINLNPFMLIVPDPD